MIDLEELLRSEEMRDVANAIHALKQKYIQDKYETDRPWPIQLTLRGRYKPEKVLGLLLDQKQYYPGYKEVLAASFAGWLIAPRSQPLREALATQVVLDHMNNAERASNVRDEGLYRFPLRNDILGHY